MPQGDMVPSGTWGQVQLTRPAKTPKTGGRGPRACPGAGGDSSCLPAKPGCFITIVQSFPPSIWSTSFSGWNSILQIFTGKRATPSSSQYVFLVAKKLSAHLLQEGHQDYPLPHSFLAPFNNNYSVYTVYNCSLFLSADVKEKDGGRECH